MKPITFVLAALAILGGSIALRGLGFGATDADSAPTDGVTIPAGYPDWPLVSIARVGGRVNDMRAKLGNDVAIRAFRDGNTNPFPDGTIIARLAWNQAASEENNDAVRPLLERQLGPEAVQKILAESFVAGPPTNVQFMIKDSKKYAATGGWAFAQFTNGKLDGEAVHKLLPLSFTG